jgi:pilus assembly protein FimV
LAINKRKILQSAQKHLQKGALDKALKDYQTLLAADPRDANVRLKIGDIHLKQGNAAGAVAAYMRVASRFMQDGFDAKAVALYKQITRIDPKRFDVYEPLAELYERLGLVSDAMAALQTAADAHYREGHRGDALDLLRKMAGLDPTNTTNRLKVADLLRQEGRTTEALAEFDEVAAELERQGDEESRLRVLERIVDADPSRFDALRTIARSHLDAGRASAAESAARPMIEQQPDELEGHELLAEALELADRHDEAVEAWRRVAAIHKERGNEGQARDIMQRFVSTKSLASGDSYPPVLDHHEELAESPAAGDSDPPVLDDHEELAFEAVGDDRELTPDVPEFSAPDYLSGEGLRLGESLEDLRMEGAEDGGGVRPDAPRGAPAPSLGQIDHRVKSMGGAAASEADAEQLLAEASVYLRYGKQERAIESLRAILARSPGHRAALEKLGEALAASGDVSQAVTALSRAAERARNDGDAEAVLALRERIAGLDPAAAEAIGPALDSAQPGGGDAPAWDTGANEHFEDVDIEIDDEAVADPSPEAPDAGSAGAFDEEPAVLTAEPDPLHLESDVDAEAGTFELDLELEFDAPEALEPAEDVEPAGAPDDDPRERSPGSATTPQEIVETLAEADFYFQQGLLEEAKALYERVLAAAPHHPQALLRIGEIEAATSGDGSLGAAVPPEPEAGFERGVEPGLPAELDVSLSGVELDLDEEDEATGAAEAGSSTASPVDPTGPLAPQETSPRESATAPLAESGHAATRGAATARATAAPARAFRAEDTAPSIGDLASETVEESASGDFDLAAELSGVLAGEDRAARAGTTEEEGFEQVFAAFKEGVRRELGEGDHQAHYDLGIAYKEMGLLEDAIAEFGKALAAPEHQLGCLHMLGLCALEIGRSADAVAHLEQALALPELPASLQVPLRFDLGRAYATAGELERARAAFETVRAEDPAFADVEAELATLEGVADASREAAVDDEETFESFDDLLEEISEEQTQVASPASPERHYESFEELFSEQDAAAETPEVAGEDGAEAGRTEDVASEEPESEPSPPPTASDRPRPRRKKISFV